MHDLIKSDIRTLPTVTEKGKFLYLVAYKYNAAPDDLLFRFVKNEMKDFVDVDRHGVYDQSGGAKIRKGYLSIEKNCTKLTQDLLFNPDYFKIKPSGESVSLLLLQDIVKALDIRGFDDIFLISVKLKTQYEVNLHVFR